MKAIVIGAGFGGLASAIRLQARGVQVTLLDRRDKPGGRGYVYQKNGYTFDGGPTVVTAPFLIEDVFKSAGRSFKDYFNLVELNTFYRIHFADGRSFDYSADTQRQITEISKFSQTDADRYEDFLSDSKDIFKKGFLELGDYAFTSIFDMIKVAPDLLKLDAVRSVYSYVSKYFKDESIRRVFSFHPLLVGGSPFRAAAIYVLIHALEKEYGVHYAMGGTGAIIKGMTRLFLELGGSLKLSSDVTQIEIDGKLAKRVHFKPTTHVNTDFETPFNLDLSEFKNSIVWGSGGVLECDFVVSNGDVVHTYKNLISPSARKKYSNHKLDKLSQSMSLVVIYFGVRKKYPELEHHNIILGERYRELISDIFQKKILADDFSLYLHIPSKTDPAMAPEGCEACYVLSPVPNLESGVDWKKIKDKYVEQVLNFLDQNHMPGLKENLEVVHSIDPIHFKDTLLSEKGNAFGVEPTLMQSAYFRPHNRSQDIKNLYFVGAGTQPGAGIPGVLLSAQATDRLIAKDWELKAASRMQAYRV